MVPLGFPLQRAGGWPEPLLVPAAPGILLLKNAVLFLILNPIFSAPGTLPGSPDLDWVGVGRTPTPRLTNNPTAMQLPILSPTPLLGVVSKGTGLALLSPPPPHTVPLLQVPSSKSINKMWVQSPNQKSIGFSSQVFCHFLMMTHWPLSDFNQTSIFFLRVMHGRNALARYLISMLWLNSNVLCRLMFEFLCAIDCNNCRRD